MEPQASILGFLIATIAAGGTVLGLYFTFGPSTYHAFLAALAFLFIISVSFALMVVNERNSLKSQIISLKHETALENSDTPRFVADLSNAFRELDPKSIKALKYFAYSASYPSREFPNWQNNGSAIDIKLLVRDPNIQWPDLAGDLAEKRREKISAIRNQLKSHATISNLIGEKAISEVIRFYQGPPSFRGLLVTDMDDKKTLFMGLYQPYELNGNGSDDVDHMDISPNNCMSIDVSGTQKPVIKISDSDEQAKEFVRNFENWFELKWSHAYQKPLIALDFDGVMANTNALKVKWISDNTGDALDLHKCNRTECEPIIGKERYEAMAREVYSKKGTKKAVPIENFKESIVELNKEFRLIVITARNEERLIYAKEWLKDHGLEDLFVHVLSERTNKLKIARDFGAVALIDDDVRHLNNKQYTDIKRVHFSAINNHCNLDRVSSWNDLKVLLISLFVTTQ